MYLLFLFGYPLDFESVYWDVIVQMVFLNCTINPFIYLVKSKDFQNALGEFLASKRFQEKTNRILSFRLKNFSPVEMVCLLFLFE